MGEGGGGVACASFCSVGASLLGNRRFAREAGRGEMTVGSGDKEAAEEEEEEEDDAELEEEDEEKEQEDDGGEATSCCSSSSLIVAALCGSSVSSSRSSSLSSLHTEWGDSGEVEKRLLLVEQ